MALTCASTLIIGAVRARASEQEDLLTGYSVTTWNEGDGRPLGGVSAIVQDPRGYLWIGSDAGLFRFDGSRFTASDEINDAPLPKVAVTALCLTRNGTLWVGFADDSAVRRIRGGHVELVPSANTPNAISDLVEDVHGMLWAIGDGVLYRFDHDAWQRFTITAAGRRARVRQAYLRRNGELLVGTWLGTFRYNERAGHFERVSTHVSWGVTEDADARLWTTDIAHGFRRIDEEPSEQPSGAGYRVMFDRDGHLWVATYGAGLWRVNVDRTVGKRVIDRAGLRTGLSSDVIQVLQEDRDGNIWVGTSGGLHRLTRRRLTPVEELGYAIAVEPDARGGMWVGTTTGLSQFARDDAQRGHGRVISQGLYVRSLYDDHHGTVWVGANEGLFRLVDGHLSAVSLPLRPGTPIASISPGRERALWLSDANWLYRWDGRRLDRFQPPDELTTAGRVVYAQSDRDGRLWVGFEFGQLGFVTEDETFHLLGPAEGFQAKTGDVVHAIFEDDEGEVWIGRSTGLGRYRHGRFAAIGRDHGLLGGQVWSVIGDSRQRLWLSVDRGLICLDRKEFENAVDSYEYRIQYRLYDTLDGSCRPFGHISASRADNGTLWFVQGGGLTRVTPEDAREDPASIVALLFIESVVTSTQRVTPPSQNVSFPHGTGRLQINYSAVALSAPNKIRFRYRLVGVDANWIDAGTLRAAFYTNLSPGKYRFQVQASAEEGIWNTSKAEFPFTIEPAFYQTSWFYAICVTIALVGVVAIWRVRMRLVKREFSLVLAERTRLSRELHDTLLQSLVGVVLQLEPIAKMIVPEPFVARNQLNRVRRQVEAYVREARASIKNLRSPSLKVRSLGVALEDFGRDAVAHTSATLRVQVSSSAPLPNDAESELFRIGQEAITNAVRHSSASRIDVLLDSTDEFVSLRVTDDGCGFDYDSEAIPDDHYGLITMRERAEELHGTLTISTVVGKGTVVEVRVPIEQPFRRAIPA